MNKILTIIVPSYNMEAYLAKGLNSLLVDDNLISLEVIVINDGSKDKTLEIANSFKAKHPETFIVINKPNGNYGSCINEALKIATGKYVKIMDADDSYDTDNLQTLIKLLDMIDVDLVVTDYYKIYSSGKTQYYNYEFSKNKILEVEKECKPIQFSNILLPAITYRTLLLKQMNYRQTEGISYTDTEWCFAPMTHVKCMYYLNIPIYRYLLDREGQTMDPNIIKKNMPQLLQCYSSLLHSIKDIQLTPFMQEFTSEQLSKHALDVYAFYIVFNSHLDRKALCHFDKELEELNPTAYKLCEKFQYRLHIPYHYITQWRKKKIKTIPLYIRLWGKILDFFGTMRLRIFKPNVYKSRL